MYFLRNEQVEVSMNLMKYPVKLLGLLPKPIIKLVAFKYVAGENMEQALIKTEKLNSEGFVTTLDILGESAYEKEKVESYVAEYKELVQEIAKRKVKSGISIKPTALGFLQSYDYALEKFKEVVEVARPHNIFIRIDMEDSPYTDHTIQLYKELKSSYNRVGIVLQAYLKRTITDIEEIGPAGDVRICKGIYIEPEEISYKGKKPIRDNFMKCVRKLLEMNFKIGVATHDTPLVDGPIKLLQEMNLDKSAFEFQMLYGVRTHLARKLVSEGYKVRLYIPYGKDWYAYSMRRMYENPYIAFHVAKALIVDPIKAIYKLIPRC